MALDFAEGVEELAGEVAEQLLRQEDAGKARRYDEAMTIPDQEYLDAAQNTWNRLVAKRTIKLLKDIYEVQVSAYRDEYGEEPNAHEDTSTAEAAT
jgi:hypothetical protein